MEWSIISMEMSILLMKSRMLAMMGDRKFRMGSVNDDSYTEIFLSRIMRDSCQQILCGDITRLSFLCFPGILWN